MSETKPSETKPSETTNDPSVVDNGQTPVIRAVDRAQAGLIANEKSADEFYYEKDLDPMRMLTPKGSVYLDQVERENAEIARAKVEGRKPDLKNPGPSAGSPLRSAAQINNALNQNVAGQLGRVDAVDVQGKGKGGEISPAAQAGPISQ